MAKDALPPLTPDAQKTMDLVRHRCLRGMFADLKGLLQPETIEDNTPYADDDPVSDDGSDSDYAPSDSGMSGHAIRETMRKQLAASDGAPVGTPLAGTSRVEAGTKRQLPIRPLEEGMSRRRLFESAPVDETIAPPNGGVSSDYKDPAPPSDNRPFLITLTANESDSRLTSGPAGLELASRAYFPGDRAFLLSQMPESAAFMIAHAAFQSMNHTIVLAERLITLLKRLRRIE